MAVSEFVRSMQETIRGSKQQEAEQSAKAAAAAGDMVAAAHHESRARAFYDSWKNPAAQREVHEETISQLRAALAHPDPNVRESARGALEESGVHSR